MTVVPTRPRLAIIGGGGAMGRLFARLLCTASSELYLFDYFDRSSSPSSLGKVFEGIRQAATGSEMQASHYELTRLEAPQTWIARPASSAPSQGRAMACLTPRPDRPHGPGDEPWQGSLINLIDRAVSVNPDGLTVVAALPEDAPEILPRADVTLLAIGIEGKSSFAEAMGFYAPWVRPSSLVVDLGSTKTEPLKLLGRLLAPQIGILGAHPLFGPTVSDLTGLIVAAMDPTDDRSRSPWREWFLERLVEHRLIVTPTTATEHDDAMSFVQALTHFTLLSFANTLVRLDRDPVDLLAFRTPVFEPLLYLAARVAHLASTNPDTYRSIQTHTTRPDVRTAFLESAKEILRAIESDQSGDAAAEPNPLSEIFARYGSPWSPDRRDRRERQRRENFLEMGARLVDGLNQLRQEIVAAAGQVRAIEERRAGQPPRVLIGIVDLDLLDPGKQDVASRIRLRPINLLLGSVQGGVDGDSGAARDQVIPLARARVLDETELCDWLSREGTLLVKRNCALLVPEWFDNDVLRHLLKGMAAGQPINASRIWDVEMGEYATRSSVPYGQKPVQIELSIILHPAELIAARRSVQSADVDEFSDAIREIELAIDRVHRADTVTNANHDPVTTLQEKDRLKRQRKKLIDQRTASVDREVRRLTRQRVHVIYEVALNWLYGHGCSSLR